VYPCRLNRVPEGSRLTGRSSLILALLIPGAALAASGAYAACPESTLDCNFATTNTSLPTDGVSCAAASRASYSIPAGKLDVAMPSYQPLVIRHARAIVRDDFTVLGPGSGVPYTLRLRVHVTGNAYSPGGFGDDAGLTLALGPTTPLAGDPAPSHSWGTFDGPVAVDDSLDLVLNRLGGSPVGLTIDATAGGNGAGTSSGVMAFAFVGLPQGWSVTSCNGYAQDGPVPAAQASWGRVKASYR
jgi:hypothetical protein